MSTKDTEPLDVSRIHVGPVESIEDLGCGICRDLYALWDQMNGAHSFETFDLIEVPEAVPYLVVLDLEDDQTAFRFRMSGQEIVAASGVDLTGELLDETGQKAPLTLKFCKAVVEANSPVFSGDDFTLEFPGRTIRFGGGLALPLLDDGGRINCVLLVHCPEP